jgi:hypothetical protein
MIDVLDREIQLVLVPFGIAAELAATVSQHAQELDIVVELGKAYLGVGVDEGLSSSSIDRPHSRDTASLRPRCTTEDAPA